MKVHVHLRELRFVTSCDKSSTVGELRRLIESQYAALNPRAPPLASHALQDEAGYLLPNALLVGDVIQDGAKVSVTLEKEVPPVAEADLQQVLSRWRYFQNYTLLALEASLKKDQGLTEGPMFVLFEMLGAESEALVRKASATLRTAVSSRNTVIPNLQGTPYGRLICGLGRASGDAQVQEDCAAILAACLQDPRAANVMEAAGAANTLTHLSRSDSKETRAYATKALWDLSHANEHSRKQINSIMRPQFPREGKESNRDSVRESLLMLETATSEAIATMALESLTRNCGEAEFRDLCLLEGPRLLKALSRAMVHFDESGLQSAVARLLCECVEHEGTQANIVYEHGGFQLLVQLSEEAELAYGSFSVDGHPILESKVYSASDPGIAQHGLEISCLGNKHSCPTHLLMSALSESSSGAVRRITSEAILQKCAHDDHNDLRQFIPCLMSTAVQSAPQSMESIHLVNIIAVLSVKEVNKVPLLRYGCAKYLCQLLSLEEADASVKLHRSAAKGLANLASSTDENRAVVLQAMHSGMPPVSSFGDSIISMYLQMVFSE